MLTNHVLDHALDLLITIASVVLYMSYTKYYNIKYLNKLPMLRFNKTGIIPVLYLTRAL